MESGLRLESLERYAPATLIVGVSGDLLEVGRALGRNGEKIGLLSRNAQLLNRYKERLEEFGVECQAFVADVTESHGVLNAIMKFSEWSPRVDRMIYNVGVLSTERAEKVTEGELARVMGANFFGFVNCFQLIQPMFQRLGHGHAVVMSSAAAMNPDGQPVAYAASKASLRIFLKALRRELAGKHITLTELFLGQVKIGEEGRDLTCEEIVDGLMRVLVDKPDEFLVGQRP